MPYQLLEQLYLIDLCAGCKKIWTYLRLIKPVWALFGLNFCLSPAKGSSGRGGSSSSGTGGSKRITGQQREAAGKGAIKEELFRKKDELIKLKSLDVFLMKDVLGTNPKKSDMKPELKEIVKRLRAKKSKVV